MGKANFSVDFKRDALRQITGRGYPVAEVSQRLCVGQHSTFEWKKKFAASNSKDSGLELSTRNAPRRPTWRRP
ncbi:transposase (plasmid) [Sinorhizobium sp. BG8]|nr:transposase [Sinorhizobium sp. BG8]